MTDLAHILGDGFSAPTRQRKGNAVYHAVKRAIILGTLAPGAGLLEQQIAAAMGCSQGTVREALLRLEQDGLVARRGYHGTVVSDTSAAMFVLTQQDIRRSGATTLPDVLRLVPGVLVTQYNDNDWQVTMRGLNVWPSNKLLVLIDGRTIYSPLTPGVFWAEQEILMEDIERIEVILGPGATVWGSNAVNGIISIIMPRPITIFIGMATIKM